MSEENFEQVAQVRDLPECAPVGVELGNGMPVCLIRVGKDVFACEDRCSHAEFPMSDGEMVDDFVIECGLHGAQFDVRTGEALELPATDGLQVFEVKIDGEAVYVRTAEQSI